MFSLRSLLRFAIVALSATALSASAAGAGPVGGGDYGQATIAKKTCAKKKVCSALSVAKTGNGTGTVTSAPAGISCGAACSADFQNGTVVTLTATPDPGSTFAGWYGGGCSGTGPCEVAMNSAQSVTATFGLDQNPLTVTTLGTGTGNVTSSPGAIDCPGAPGDQTPGTCSQNFDGGQVVTLTATPDPGSTFAGWSGGGCSGTGPCEVAMNSAQSVTATFTTP